MDKKSTTRTRLTAEALAERQAKLTSLWSSSCSVAEMAEQLGISVEYVYSLARKLNLPEIKRPRKQRSDVGAARGKRVSVKGLVEGLVKYCSDHGNTESGALTISPQHFVFTHNMFDYIADQTNISREQIGKWFNSQQELNSAKLNPEDTERSVNEAV